MSLPAFFRSAVLFMVCTLCITGVATAAPAVHKEVKNDPLAEFIQTLPDSLDKLSGTLHNLGNDVVMHAMSMVGVLYKRGGNSQELGLDCSGLVKLVYAQTLGLILPRTAAEQSRVGDEIAVGDLRPGDLVFYNTLKRPNSHVGIYIGDGQFVHSPRAGSKVRVERMTDSYWTRRFEGARRVVKTDAQ